MTADLMFTSQGSERSGTAGRRSRHAEWDKDRQALEAQLRKKDEMVTMLSATFQNLLKKPS